jgi:hypothetical protein
MSDSASKHTSPSTPDGDGVRIVREYSARARWALALRMLALVLVAAGGAYLLYPARSTPSPPAASTPAPAQGSGASAPAVVDATIETAEGKRMTPPRRPSAQPAQPPSNPADWRSGDDNDIATYLSPDDPEPTMTEVIQALRDSGDHGGIAAFNPPGTSPPLHGLAVPENFVLPPGYVRHHQVTDAGQPIEAILMYAPDYVFQDAHGRPIPIPEDRVVPPEMAPPGLPIRPITIPPPQE